MTVLVTASTKGGVGKTLISCNVAGELQRRGHYVLLIDLDPQATATNRYGVSHSPAVRGTAEVLSPFSPAPFSEVVTQGVRENMDLLAASRDPLYATEGNLLTAQMGDLSLLRALAPIRDMYDWIIIDAPPNIGKLPYNGVVAADAVVGISDLDPSALRGAAELEALTDNARDTYQNVHCQFLGVVWNRVDKSPRLVGKDVQRIADETNVKQFSTRIYRKEGFQQASYVRRSAFELYPDGDEATMISDLVDEIVMRCAQRGIAIPAADQHRLSELSHSSQVIDLATHTEASDSSIGTRNMTVEMRNG